MSEASTTEPTNTDPTSESADKNLQSSPEQSNDTAQPTATVDTSADQTVESATPAQTEGDAPDEPTSKKQEETDDWAAAMAEQAAATDEVAASGDAVANAQTSSPFEQLSKEGALANARNDIDMILDIPVQLTVELGRTKIAIKNLMQLAQGSVVELDGMAGEPMDVLVNGCLIAQGEVVVVNDKFGIRLTDIITPSERIRKLNR